MSDMRPLGLVGLVFFQAYVHGSCRAQVLYLRKEAEPSLINLAVPSWSALAIAGLSTDKDSPVRPGEGWSAAKPNKRDERNMQLAAPSTRTRRANAVLCKGELRAPVTGKRRSQWRMVYDHVRSVAFDNEMLGRRSSSQRGELEAGLAHLERAHVIGQAFVVPHARSHWLMLKVEFRRRRAVAAFGQGVRIVLGVLGSAVGVVPVGNTGGSDISMFKRMPIEPELQNIIDGGAPPDARA